MIKKSEDWKVRSLEICKVEVSMDDESVVDKGVCVRERGVYVSKPDSLN